MDFTAITVGALKAISSVSGGFGLAIILLTVAVRLAMWPLSLSQQRSMKKMQMLSPKLKELQARYKSQPQVLQQKMMEFYKEHKFNPMGGCLPMLMQLPIFILLYSALMSPQFIQVAGDSSFLFVHRLDATLKSTDAVSQDGVFGVKPMDTFGANKKVLVTFNDGEQKEIDIKDPKKAIEVQGEIIPNEPMDLKISLDNLNLKFSELEEINSAEISVMNNGSRELEIVKFERKGPVLAVSVPTKSTKTDFNYDVLFLIIIFGVTMFLSQKVLMNNNSQASMDPNQEMIQKSMSKMMPLMVMGMFIFIPIPAGVLLYLVASNVVQVVQTVVINKQIEEEEVKSHTLEAEIVEEEKHEKE